MSNQPEQPKGLFLFGTDGKIYTAEASALKDVTSQMEGVHGLGIPVAAFVGDAQPEDEADVEGHDLDNYGYWHRYLKWGWIIDQYGYWAYRRHYHPYGTGFCIYYD